MRPLTLLFLLFPLFLVAQQRTHRQGEMYVYWGWNRAAFSRSTIHFTGDDLDFKLYKVKATDKQSRFTFNRYFNPGTITIPQYNFRIGVYLDDHYDLSIGADHMKYVMLDGQQVKISGSISGSDTGFDGDYDRDTVTLNPAFLQFEHTDGLNYENIEIRRSDVLWSMPHLRIESRVGVGIGALIPRSNVTLLNNARYDEFHVAGYGLGLIGGLHISIFKYFFVQFETKGGFIHMPSIRTTMDASDSASQAFFFGQVNGVFGANFFLFPQGSD